MYRARKRIKRQIQGGLLLFTFVIAVIFCIYRSLFPSPTSNDLIGSSRTLQADSVDDDYYINSLDEFPPLLFSYDEIKNGWWLLNFFGMFYCFLGIAIICDDYFVPAIEVIVVKLNMSEDTAGATWLAAGGSAPELFTSFVGTFVAQSDVGFGTIVGSAVFNVLFIVGACAIFTSGNLKLQWWPFARDMSYYLLCLAMLALFFGGISKNQMKWWESIILLCMYFIYVFIMTQNERIKAWVYKRLQYKDETRLLDAHKDDYGAKEISMQKQKKPELKIVKDNSVDTSIDKSIPKLITIDDDDMINRIHRGSSKGMKSGKGSYVSRKGKSFATDPGVDNSDSDDDDNSDSESEEDGLNLSFPDNFKDRCWYILKAPLTFPIYFTLFDVLRDGGAYEDWWPWTFFGSLVWLGGLSYLMVWWCVVVGFAWGVPQELMGLVFLAAGTSVPELFSCIIVAKKGKADMAVSASIGSNIFDVLVGLPLPWFLFSVTNANKAKDMHIDVEAHGLFLSILVLIVILGCLLVLILVNKWVLTHCMGWAMIGLYVFFVVQDLIRYYFLDIEF